MGKLKHNRHKLRRRKMLRKCCEFCEYYEAEYNLKCSSCRFEDDEACNYSNFEVSKELIEWKESNENL